MRDWLQDLASAGAAAKDAVPPEGFARPGEVILLLRPAGAFSMAHSGRVDLDRLLARLRERNFLKSLQRVHAGGIGGALLRACKAAQTGFDLSLGEDQGADLADALFGESDARALVTCWASAHLAIANFVNRSGSFTGEAIGRVTAGEVRLRWMGETVLRASTRDIFD